MKKTIIWVLFVYFLSVSLLIASENLPDKRAYFVGKVGDRAVQIDISWHYNGIEGLCYLGENKSTINAEKRSFKKPVLISLSKDNMLTLSNIDGNPNLSASLVKEGSSKCESFIVERIAEYSTRKMTYSNKVGVDVYYPLFWNRNVISRRANEIISSKISCLENKFDKDMEDPNYFFEGFSYVWFCDDKYSVKYYSSHLISMSLFEYENGGGAHGNTYTEGISIIEKDNKGYVLKLEDLLNKNNVAALKLCTLVRSELNLQEGADWIPEDDSEMLKILNQFTISYDGITFYFAPYVVGCYAAGDFEVILDWNQLKDIVDTDGVLKEFY